MTEVLREVSELDIRVTDLPEEELDAQPFGIIRLDRRGRILSYNTYEERLARKSRDEVIGQSFFFDVAPCTRVRAFYGRFVDGVARGSLRARFEFVFTFAHGDRHVDISLVYKQRDETVWVLIRADRKDGEPVGGLEAAPSR